MLSIISDIKKSLILVLLFLTSNNNYVLCFPLNYSSFPRSLEDDFILANESYIINEALQVTRDTSGGNITNLTGRIVYNEKFKLWNDTHIANFNSTFVLNITPKLNGGGEGIAFILAKDSGVPSNSEGQWLGIVNALLNGSSQSSIVAIEFDTKKSFPEDVDGNHVGLDINSVLSEKQVSLNSSDIVIASGPEDVTAMILYDGSTKMMDVYVYKGNKIGSSLTKPVISMFVDVRNYLPKDVYVGFSGSTSLSTELNCVKAWFFNGSDLGSGSKRFRIRILIWIWIWIWTFFPIILVLCVAGGYWYRRKKQNHVDSSNVGDENTIARIETGLGPKKIKLKDIKVATGNFNPSNVLGRGGFGVVFKGVLDGIDVAVKRVTNTPEGKQNLMAEVTTIGNLHHKNLVRLIGWCLERDELILVYEYMSNGSLDYYIYSEDERMILSWEIRHNIIRGVAQALDYLHNECSRRVLHRDIKASNIMLDSDFNACLGDFGLARMFRLSEKTHHSTKEIAGTPGYMAPEIFHTGRATSESDVFAFGVLALVLACGKKAMIDTKDCEYRESLVDWVWELYGLEAILEAIDTKLEGEFDNAQAECMLVLGLACCHPNPYLRPSMRIVLQVLMGEVLPSYVPRDKPTFMWPATSPSFTREDSSSGGMLTPITSLSGR